MLAQILNMLFLGRAIANWWYCSLIGDVFTNNICSIPHMEIRLRARVSPDFFRKRNRDLIKFITFQKLNVRSQIAENIEKEL